MSEPRGFSAVGVFLCFGATMAAFAAFTLLRPGTVLDEAWKLNPTAHAQLAPLGIPVGLGFLLLVMVLAVAAVGWFRHRLWGWILTVVVLGTQVAGDALNLFRGDLFRGVAGVLIAGLLLLYLLTPRVRACFPRNRPHGC